MPETLYKYYSEAALNVCADESVLLPVQDFYDFEKRGDAGRYHIYAVVARPRSVFDAGSIVWDGNSLCGKILYGGKPLYFRFGLEEVSFYTQGAITFAFAGCNPKDVELSLNEAGTTLYVSFANPQDIYDRFLRLPEWPAGVDTQRFQKAVEEFGIKFLAETVLQLMFKDGGEPYEMEVLYIGQAQGREKERGAADRLKNHETLQKILVDCHAERTDIQLYILLFSFQEKLITMFNGWEDEFSAPEGEQAAHTDRMIAEMKNIARGQGDAEERKRQVINITEAAMIHYFKPAYNEKFVTNFPAKEHTSYRRYFDLEYNAVVVELGLEPPYGLVTAHGRVACQWDLIRYALHKDGRKDIFSLFEEM